MHARHFLVAVAAAATALAVPFSSFVSSSTNSQSHPASARSPPPVIDLGYTRVQGYYNATADQYWWKGIRYATAERFRAPRTPAAHLPETEVVQANTYGDVCWQASMGGLDLSTIVAGTRSEDCLFLNVIAPARAREGSDLPVHIWIHGGGYAIGSTANGSDFSEFIVNAGNNLVVVTFQYRLGAFGFLAGREMAESGVLNAGLLDQQFAFRWVQQHISKFGGDPSHVTIWGESAGAGSVMHHLVANGGNTQAALGLERPLFHAAIGSSVFTSTQVPFDSALVEATYSALVRAVGCADSATVSFTCLQQVKDAKLAAAALNLTLSKAFAVWTFLPVIEGKNGFLRERASVALARGSDHLNGEHVLAINNRDEGRVFTDPRLLNDSTSEPEQLACQMDQHLTWQFPLLNEVERQAVADAYPISAAPQIGNTFARMSAVIADANFVCPTYWTAEAFGRSGWKGIFNYGDATHGIDTAWYQGPIWNGEHSVSALTSFAGSFEGFVLTYDPNNNPATDLNPLWPTFDSGKEMYFNTTRRDTLSEADPRIVHSSSILSMGKTQEERCDFWRSADA